MKDVFIGKVGFKCSSKGHENGYTKYTATDFISQIAVLMDGVNIIDLDAKEKANFMGALMSACLSKMGDFC